MIKEVCGDIKRALESGEPLELVDVIAGLTEVVTYQNTDGNDNVVTKRMPVSYNTNLIDCGKGKERDLIPDSRRKGMIYLEDNGGVNVLRALSGGRFMYRGNIVLVCWMNRKKTVGEAYADVGKASYDKILDKLRGTLPSSNFTSLRVQPTRFRQDGQVFAKYTYDETVLQYLRPPFEYFAIDLSITFVGGCATNLTLNPALC